MKKQESLSEDIYIKEVNENIRRVMLGEPLTRPLKQLNRFCEFRKEWNNKFNIIDKEKIAKQMKAYREANKEKMKAYQKEFYKSKIKGEK
jgi:hypothetical protein